MVGLGIFAATLLVSAPDSAIPAERMAEARAEVAQAEQRWQIAAPAIYSYSLISGGAFGYRSFQIRVMGEQCSARWRFHFGGKVGAWKSDVCDNNTIPEIFAEIRRQLTMPMERIELAFDPAFGFPTKASFEPHSEIPDQSSYFEISEFKVREARK